MFRLAAHSDTGSPPSLGSSGQRGLQRRAWRQMVVRIEPADGVADIAWKSAGLGFQKGFDGVPYLNGILTGQGMCRLDNEQQQSA